jgi:peptidoglycan/xylan/chitin deacetylase (PgdA/CDA1 family)
MNDSASRLVSNVKDGARFLAGTICSSPPLRPLARRFFQRHTNIVYYHLIGAKQPYFHAASDRAYTLDQFSQDLAKLKKVFKFTTIEKIFEYNRGGVTSEEPLLALTFDDGLSQSYPELMQIFDYHGVKATQFLIMACVDNRNLMWRSKTFVIDAALPEEVYVARYNALGARAGFPPIRSGAEFRPASAAWKMAQKDELADELWRACDMPPLAEYLDEHRPYLSWKEIDQWLAAGHGVGLHTLTHPYCSRLTDDEIEDEIVRPAAELRKRLNLSFLSFSYPFGNRVSGEREQALLDRGVFDCALGIRGLSPRGTAPHRLERAGIEGWGIDWAVFGRPMMLSGLTGSASR